jgi:hypothetical protein
VLHEAVVQHHQTAKLEVKVRVYYHVVEEIQVCVSGYVRETRSDGVLGLALHQWCQKDQSPEMECKLIHLVKHRPTYMRHLKRTGRGISLLRRTSRGWCALSHINEQIQRMWTKSTPDFHPQRPPLLLPCVATDVSLRRLSARGQIQVPSANGNACPKWTWILAPRHHRGT